MSAPPPTELRASPERAADPATLGRGHVLTGPEHAEGRVALLTDPAVSANNCQQRPAPGQGIAQERSPSPRSQAGADDVQAVERGLGGDRRALAPVREGGVDDREIEVLGHVEAVRDAPHAQRDGLFAAQRRARSVVIQYIACGRSTCSMRALVSMPRSPTQATRAMPKRALSLLTCAATVAGSAVLPANTSTAIGTPCAVQIRPKTICASSRLPSRECPRAASAQQRPVSHIEVRS